MKQVPRLLPANKRIALVAHDNMKQTLLNWAKLNIELLKNHQLVGTGTTGFLLESELDLKVDKLFSGPLGGDQQIGAEIAEGKVHGLFFFWDPFEPLPHDPDIKALLRIAAVWNTPVACNPATAQLLLMSDTFNTEFEIEVPDDQDYLRQRTAQLID